jgi:hypothetical protein
MPTSVTTNQSKLPQYGQAASPAGSDGVMFTSLPQTGHRFGEPSGVLDEIVIVDSAA